MKTKLDTQALVAILVTCGIMALTVILIIGLMVFQVAGTTLPPAEPLKSLALMLGGGVLAIASAAATWLFSTKRPISDSEE